MVGARVTERYPRLQEYRESIVVFLTEIGKHARGMGVEQLRAELVKIKQIADSCMSQQVMEKMAKHHRVLQMKQQQQQLAQQQAAVLAQQQRHGGAGGAPGVGAGTMLGVPPSLSGLGAPPPPPLPPPPSGPPDPALVEARASLKQKVVQLLPIRVRIKEKLETSDTVPDNFKKAYTIIRKRIEQIVEFYTKRCTTLANVDKCTQYLYSTVQEWKKVIAAHQEMAARSVVTKLEPVKMEPGGAAGVPAQDAGAAASAPTDTSDYIHRLQSVYRSCVRRHVRGWLACAVAADGGDVVVDGDDDDDDGDGDDDGDDDEASVLRVIVSCCCC